MAASAALVCGWGGSARGDEAPPVPRLVVEKAEIDLGRVVRGKAVEATFELRNEGGAELRILSAKPGWGCAVASFDEVIPPGRVGTIRATVQTDRYRGPVSKGITVTSNDPQRGTLQLTVKLDIAGSVTLLPGQVLTVGNLRGRTGPGRLVVRKDPSETGALRIDGLRVSAPWLSVRAHEVGSEAPGVSVEGVGDVRPGDWILEATIDGAPPDATRMVTVTFATGLSREPSVSVPVQVLWLPPIRFSTPTVVVNPSADTPPPLVVSFRPDVDMRGASVVTEPEGLEARLEPANAQAMHVRLRWAGGGPPPAEGRVVVRAGSETAAAVVRFATVPQAAPASR